MIHYNKEELENIRFKAKKFAILCYKEDSLKRAQTWSKFAHITHQLIKEEEIHNFQFPSPIKPKGGN